MKWPEIIISFVMTVLLTVSAQAQDRIWVGTAGDGLWSTAENWSTMGTPQNGESVLIADDAASTVMYDDTTADNFLFNYIHLDNNNALELSNALNLNAKELIPGVSGSGDVEHNNGTVNVENLFSLGSQSSGSGTYFLYDGQLLTGTLAPGKYAQELIGDAGTGLLYQESGRNTVVGDLTLGKQANSYGEYDLNDQSGSLISTPSLSVRKTVNGPVLGGNLFIGDSGTGLFNHNSGIVMVESLLSVGKGTVGSGEYDLYDGQLLVGGNGMGENAQEVIGDAGSGYFYQYGGKHRVSGDLRIGTQIDSYGEYVLDDQTDATLNSPSLGVQGVNYVGGNIAIGDQGTGLFVQKAGVVTAENICMGCGGLGKGTYNLQGGTLSILHEYGYERIGAAGIGTFNQNGGVNDATGALILGESSTGVGEYNLLDGELNSHYEHVGWYGYGVFNQNGGVNNVGSYITGTGLQVGNYIGSVGEYNLNQGVLNAGGESIGGFFGGRGVFTQNGGVNNTSSISFGIDSPGEYNLNNGVINAVSEIGGSKEHGTFNQNGGVNNVSNMLGLGYNSGTGEYNLNHGVLSAGKEYIGDGGAGIFNQTGGSHNVSSALYIRSMGQYNMTGGSLTAGVVHLNGNGQEVGFTPALFFYNNGYFNIHDGGTAAQPIIVRGNITNNNEFTVNNAVVKFDGSFQNNGYFHSDPSTINFLNLTIGSSGYITAAEGDGYHIAGDFLNHSMQSALWSTQKAKLIFGTGEHIVALAGADLGPDGFTDNFSWGVLDLTDIDMLVLEDGNPFNSSAALYIGELLGLKINGQTIGNIYGNGLNIYYNSLLAENSYLKGGTYQLADGGKLIPVVTPEPAAMVLYGLGALPLAAHFIRRRRTLIMN